jgi:pimeloyl-ACP methyl ester carboxylesterase
MTANPTSAPSIDRRRMLGGTAGFAAVLAASTPAGAAPATPAEAPAGYVAQPAVYRSTVVDGRSIFYREAGDPAAPTVLLLHGFPASSHMFRDLIPLLADRFHLVAPDHLGFGHSDAPSAAEFAYTFDHLADLTERVVDALGLARYSLYLHDYGGPVGFRLATRRPDRVQALILQNTNAYEEGLTQLAQPLRTAGQQPRTAESDAALRQLLTPETTRFQYLEGVRDPERISPDGWTSDQSFIDRPGNDEIQLTLFYDYLSNLKRYPEWHAYFREHQPPTLIVWGQNDPFFNLDGARAYARDLPDAELHLLDAGHFALEDHADVIAGHIARFLDTHVDRGASY